MQTECSADLLGFPRVEGVPLWPGLTAAKMTSDAGALLLRGTNRAIGLIERFTECFADSRAAELIEHEVRTLVGQRVFGIGLGYEDLSITTNCARTRQWQCWRAKLSARRKDCARWLARAPSTGWSWAGRS